MLGQRLRNIVLTQKEHLRMIEESESEHFSNPGKWSAKQIIGHLIDSASNNHQRFVRAQFNLHLARVIDHIPAAKLRLECTIHNLHQIAWKTVPEDQSTTLYYFIQDYIDHLENHLKQII